MGSIAGHRIPGTPVRATPATAPLKARRLWGGLAGVPSGSGGLVIRPATCYFREVLRRLPTRAQPASLPHSLCRHSTARKLSDIGHSCLPSRHSCRDASCRRGEKRRDESRRCRQECLRHGGRETFMQFCRPEAHGRSLRSCEKNHFEPPIVFHTTLGSVHGPMARKRR